VVASVAKEYGKLEALVDLSQMTVSQMTATSTAESHQQRLHWLAEQVLNWSGLPVVHIRPTVFLDTPLFTTMAARSIQENGTIALPFGTGRTSPVAVDDVARVIATVLRNAAPHIGHVYELTGPNSVDMSELAAAFSRALDRPVSYVDVPLDRWLAGLSRMGLPPHTEQHVATMAQLHRDNRYDRTADGVERVTWAQLGLGRRRPAIERARALVRAQPTAPTGSRAAPRSTTAISSASSPIRTRRPGT